MNTVKQMDRVGTVSSRMAKLADQALNNRIPIPISRPAGRIFQGIGEAVASAGAPCEWPCPSSAKIWARWSTRHESAKAAITARASNQKARETNGVRVRKFWIPAHAYASKVEARRGPIPHQSNRNVSAAVRTLNMVARVAITEKMVMIAAIPANLERKNKARLTGLLMMDAKVPLCNSRVMVAVAA